MEENCKRSQGSQRAVVLLKKKKPIEKRPLGRPMRRWEDIIRMDLEEIGIKIKRESK